MTSAPLRKLIKKMFSNGVDPNDSTAFQVTNGTGMNVIVKAGFAICDGCMKLEESDRTLSVQESDDTYDRIDTVVLRMNDNDSYRLCDLYVVKGTPASSPVRPDLTRSGAIYELGLADLFISKNTTTISDQRITPTRFETERCGVILPIAELDTTAIYNQLQAQVDENIALIQSAIDETTAGNLQLQINALVAKVSAIQSQVGDAYSSTETYAVGEYCIYTNVLYKCTTAIEEAEEWNAEHWTATTCSDEIIALNNNFTNRNTPHTYEITPISSGVEIFNATATSANGVVTIAFKFKFAEGKANPTIATSTVPYNSTAQLRRGVIAPATATSIVPIVQTNGNITAGGSYQADTIYSLMLVYGLDECDSRLPY